MAMTNPARARGRGNVPDRQMMVEVTRTNTLAARAAITNMYEKAADRAASIVAAVSGGAASNRLFATRLATCAAPDQYIATNNRPLPRNTVARNRSSCWPIRSRTTPMNHRNVIPANGAR